MNGGRADAARTIPLAVVATGLGYRKDPTDRSRWKRPGSVISINGPKFYDHIAGCGGGGAIDLVIHAEGCGFLEALRRLEALPCTTEQEWARVHRYLCRERELDPGLVDHARRIGILEADSRANAVFVCRGRDGRRTGAELVGTGGGRSFRGMARGSRKSAGGFWIARQETPKRALLAEGAIDALSAWSLAEAAGIDIVISTAGVTGRMPEWIGGLRLETIFCGYDADDAGDHAAGMLAAQDPAIRRLRPDGGKVGRHAAGTVLLKSLPGKRVLAGVMTPRQSARPAPPVLARHVISFFPGSLSQRQLLSSMATGRAGLHSQTGTMREELSQGARNSAGNSRRSNPKTNSTSK